MRATIDGRTIRSSLNVSACRIGSGTRFFNKFNHSEWIKRVSILKLIKYIEKYINANITLLVQLHQKQPLVLLRFGDVGRNVRVLRRLKVRAPPVADRVLHYPVLLDAVLPAEGLTVSARYKFV